MEAFFRTYGIEDQVIAAGVSGGADSLALVWQLKQWAERNGRRIVALTVDHGLRRESREEALYVAGLMADWGIEHHLLVWEGEKPSGDIEARAREARYSLMAGWCLKNGVKTLAVGHHMQDQAETFLMRLCRGSGVYGLSAMLPVTECWGITLVRPQLEQQPEDLRNLLQQLGVAWKEDLSNQSEDFFRTRIRHYLPELEKRTGLTRERLAETAAVLARSRSLIEQLVRQEIAENVADWQGIVKSLPQQILKSWHSELLFRILAALIRVTGHRKYAPESEELLRLSGLIVKPDFKGCTLGDCEIISCRGKIWILPEIRNKPVLRREVWAEWVQRFPELQNVDLPYKVRQAIYLLNQQKTCI